VEESEISFLGGIAPVTVTATNGAVVDVNFSVKFIVETRDHDTLRLWADNFNDRMAALAVKG